MGHIFHAIKPNGGNLICLVTAVTEEVIQARTVTSQIPLAFDRQTGGASWDEDKQCFIDCVTPLPADIHNVLLALDKKYQDDAKSGHTKLDSQFRLTESEKRALLFTRSFYEQNRFIRDVGSS